MTCSGLVFGRWETLGDLVMVQPLTDCGHTRRSLFVQLPSSNVDFSQGTIRVTSEPFPTRLSPITPVPPLPYDQKRHGKHTTTSSRGFPDNGYRMAIIPSSWKLHVSNIFTSSCTCPGEDHPGPPQKGRGAPEIDVFEAERNKTGGIGGIVSQSAQFAPFTHDYLYDNSTLDRHTIYDPSITVQNTYRGSAVYVTTFFLFGRFS